MHVVYSGMDCGSKDRQEFRSAVFAIAFLYGRIDGEALFPVVR